MSKELLKRALEVIDQAEIYAENEDKALALYQAIEAELAKPEPEPVAYILQHPENSDLLIFKRDADQWSGRYIRVPLYTKPIE